MEYEEHPDEQINHVTESEDNEEETKFESFKPKKQNIKNKNLTLRWSKRQPTKMELTEHFIELKSTLTISQNSIIIMEKRITTLETDIAQLIEYINTKI